MSDPLSDLHKAHREWNEKYAYFVLAAAGAAIAFAVTQTKDAIITPSTALLALALLCWGLSFMCGCWHLSRVSNLLQQNYQFLRVQAGQHPEFPAHPDVIQMIRGVLEEQSNASGKYAYWQFRMLWIGALFYIAWHGWQMYERTPAAAPKPKTSMLFDLADALLTSDWLWVAVAG